MAKPRFDNPETRALTQNVIAHSLDQLLRLLHPIMPFVTEEIWTYLNQAAPIRGLIPAQAESFGMIAKWPEAQSEHHDESIERQFTEFQEVVAAIRQIRANQKLKNHEIVPVNIRCSESSAALLSPMKPYLASLAKSDVQEIGPKAPAFETDAPLAIPSIDVHIHVDLEQFIDVGAELNRLEKLLGQVVKQITGKEQKLSNENFVSRAPKDVVDKERESLDDLLRQRASIEGDIERLKSKG